jgi:hypothetical protein
MAAEKAVLGELLSHGMEVERQSSGVLELLRALQARTGGPATSSTPSQPGVTWATSGWGPGSARPFAGPPPVCHYLIFIPSHPFQSFQ